MDFSRRRPTQILTECDKIAHQFLKAQLAEYFKELDARLLEFAEKARTNSQQTQLFEVTRALKQRKIEIEVDFLHELKHGFSLFMAGKLGGRKEAREDLTPDLSLLANDKLEVELAQSSFARRAETRYNEDLYALNQRFAMLLGGKKIPDDGNPIGPSQLAACLQKGIASSGITSEIKIIILFYKVFEKQMLPQLGKLYAEINQSLIQAGVLPNLRYSVARQPGAAAKAPAASHAAQPAATAPATGVQPVYRPGGMQARPPCVRPQAPVAPMHFVPVVPRHVVASIATPDPRLPSQQYQQELYGAIRAMQQAVVRPPDWRKPGEAASSKELVSVINNVQAVAAINADRLDDAEIAPCDTVVAAGMTSQKLQEEVNRETGKSVNDDNANMIDLVGMIFEYMLGDGNLPDNVKAVLSYLHTPFLKIAFLDPELFAKPEHPARLLLNTLEETGSKWVSNDGTSQFKAFPKIKSVVRRVLMEFSNDLRLIEELLEEIREFNQKVQSNVELLERRAAQKAEGEDRLKQVKKLVNQTVRSLIDGKKLPSPVVVLLLHPWSEYLTFVLLRHGETSEDWTQGVETIKQILWSIQPKSTPEEKKQLISVQDVLQQELQHAFNQIAYDQAKAAKLLEAVHELHVIALQNKSAQAAPAQVRQEIEATAVGHEEAQEGHDEATTPEERELVDKLRMVEFGTWIEFDELDGQKNQRLKIAWFNARTLHYMLVNRAGKQAATLSAVEIARHMLSKNARIISGTAKPFFERALENIFSRMQASAA